MRQLEGRTRQRTREYRTVEESLAVSDQDSRKDCKAGRCNESAAADNEKQKSRVASTTPMMWGDSSVEERRVEKGLVLVM